MIVSVQVIVQQDPAVFGAGVGPHGRRRTTDHEDAKGKVWGVIST